MDSRLTTLVDQIALIEDVLDDLDLEGPQRARAFIAALAATPRDGALTFTPPIPQHPDPNDET